MSAVRWGLATASCLILATSAASAEEVPVHFTPVAAMGMGGAYTAVAHDDEAVWTNPAGIARSRKARSRSSVHVAKFPNIIAGVNSESRAFYKGLKGSQDENVEGLIAEADGIGDKPFWVRAAMFPVFIFDPSGRNVPTAVGAYTNTTVKALVDKNSPSDARLSAISDVGVTFGSAFTTDSNRFSFGFQARPVYRYAYEGVVPSSDLVKTSAMKGYLKDGANKATGFGLDAGVLMTLADFWFPTLGIAILNLPTGCQDDYLNPFSEERQKICGNLFRGDLGNPDALSRVDPTDVRVGIAISPRLSRELSLRFALDVHHIHVPAGGAYYGVPSIDPGKMLHAGVEFFIGNPLEQSPFSIRMGTNQGFVAFGLALNMGLLSLDISTWGQDISSSVSKREDRRTLVGLTSTF